MMEGDASAERIVAAATELGQPEFTRAAIAERLGVSVQDLKDGFKGAREGGRIEKVREDDDGKGIFRLTGR